MTGMVITDNSVVKNTPAEANPSFALYSFANTTIIDPAGSAPDITNNSLLNEEIGNGKVMTAIRIGNKIKRRTTTVLIALHFNTFFHEAWAKETPITIMLKGTQASPNILKKSATCAGMGIFPK